MLHRIKLLGSSITSEKEDKILEYVVDGVTHGTKKLFITTPNPEILVYAQAHPEYQKKINEADVALPDGVGLVIGSYLMKKPIKERITGTDFIEKLCLACREPRFNRGEKPMSMGFLGGRGGVAELTAERLKKKYPWIEVVWVGEEWSNPKNDAVRSISGDLENSARGPVPGSFPQVLAASQLRASGSPSARATPRISQGIDILFVALGAPKQEEWIYENLPHLPVKAAMGVGGAFDYISGRVPRAPKLLRAIGLEWLFRLIVQPWRWKRQLALLKFLFLILRERFSSSRYLERP